jgi:beta-lactam-binding protein with PASTA domain
MQTWGIHNRFSIDARYVFILSFVFVVPLGNVAWPQNKFQVTKVASIHTIPSFSADETYADVIARLKELDVGIDPRAEPSCRPAQKFLRTEPESGSTLPNGGPVVVFYSKGPPLAGTVVRIPAFKGQPASNVTKVLESMLLRVTEKSIASALRKGTFLRTEPIAATDVAACSEVVVVASNGIAPVESTIPNVPSKPVFEPDSAAAATSACYVRRSLGSARPLRPSFI